MKPIVTPVSIAEYDHSTMGIGIFFSELRLRGRWIAVRGTSDGNPDFFQADFAIRAIQ
jgi:hypothetical protein